jgi:hypothetical protein
MGKANLKMHDRLARVYCGQRVTAIRGEYWFNVFPFFSMLISGQTAESLNSRIWHRSNSKAYPYLLGFGIQGQRGMGCPSRIKRK